MLHLVHGEDVVEDLDEVVEDLDEVVGDAQRWPSHLAHVVVLLFHVGHGEDDCEDHASVGLDVHGLEHHHVAPCCGRRCHVGGRHAHGGHGHPVEDDLVEDVHVDEHGDVFLLA